MAGINIQAADHTNRFITETALLPACPSLTGGSSNPPKFGTLIPNRIFVGGIPSNTTEQELKTFFSTFGQVKDVKIISDRLGVSKGSYGFVTFESQEMAEKIIKNESETLIFKDRKLNIGHAIRKQQMFPRPDLPTALFFAGGAMPYSFQNGMAVFPLPGQEYPMLTQATAPYATMMLSQPGGSTTLYLPPSLHSAASAAASPYAPISQQAVTAAMQQQHFHQTGGAAGLTPAVVGQIASVPVSNNSNGAQSHSTAAVMAAAAAAMAAAVQWPPQTAQSNGHQQNSQLAAAVAAAHGVAQANNNQHSVAQSPTISHQQAAAVAAAVAAQQQAVWRWSPSLQQSQNAGHGASPTQSTVCSVATTGTGAGVTASTTTLPTQNIQSHQQGSANPSLGPATYLYSPITGAGHELMFFHQTSSPFAGNSTSDYSTDHSTHSSGILESVESLSFQCDGTPVGRHTHLSSQLAGAYGNPHLDGSCLSPYATFAPILDLQSQSPCINQQNTTIPHAHLQHQLRQTHQPTPLVPNPQATAAQHLVSIVNAPPALVSQSQHNKIYSTSALSSVGHNSAQGSTGICTRQLSSAVYGNPTMKNGTLSDLGASNELTASSITQTQGLPGQTVSGVIGAVTATPLTQGSTSSQIPQASSVTLTSTAA